MMKIYILILLIDEIVDHLGTLNYYNSWDLKWCKDLLHQQYRLNLYEASSIRRDLIIPSDRRRKSDQYFSNLRDSTDSHMLLGSWDDTRFQISLMIFSSENEDSF